MEIVLLGYSTTTSESCCCRSQQHDLPCGSTEMTDFGRAHTAKKPILGGGTTKVPPGTITNLDFQSPELAIYIYLTVTSQQPRRSFSSTFASTFFFFFNLHMQMRKKRPPSKQEHKDEGGIILR